MTETNNNTRIQSPQGVVHWPSALQLGFSLLATLALWGLAATLFVGGFIGQYLQGFSPYEVLQYFLLAGGAALCGFLLLPASFFAFQRLAGRPQKQLLRLPGWLRPTLLIFALPILLLFGSWIYQQEQFAWLILPPVHALAIGLPIMWFVYLAIRNLSSASPQRHWGVFSTGLVLAPALSFFVEILVGITLLFAWSVWISTQPDLMRDLTNLAQRLEQARISPEEFLALLQPYIAQPAVIFAILGFFTLVVPLVEETIKPLGVWLLANRNLSPADGFAAGVLSGAGFALAESLALASSGGDWALAVFTRIGTGTIHILASGLVGWALARAWGNGKYFQLGASYLLAVLIHSVWNLLSILLALSYVPDMISIMGESRLLSIQGELIPYLLGLLALIAFISLLAINRALNRQKDRLAVHSTVV